MDCLPDEVWGEEIFWRLPVKSIIQCRCVCKSWCSLITDPNFISKYLHNNTQTLNPQILLNQEYSSCSNVKPGNCLLHFDNNQDHQFRPILLHDLTRPSRSTFIRIIGSVNGLICISIDQGEVIVTFKFIFFNPSIGRFLSIPPPPLSALSNSPPASFQTMKGLGFDETTQDYKILFIVSRNCFIYSLNSNCWRKLITPPILKISIFYRNSDYVVFVNGLIHWLAIIRPYQLDRINFIMVFDVKDETFRRISLPKCLVNAGPDEHSMNLLSIAEFGESSIAVISQQTQHVAHIWVMKDYDIGSEGSWFKLATVDSELSSIVLGFRNKDEVLLRNHATGYSVGKRACVISQNINRSEEVKNLIYMAERIPFVFRGVYKYVPSLVLLDKEKNFEAAIDVTPDLELRRSKRARKAPARYH